jgi:hypothetical protein
MIEESSSNLVDQIRQASGSATSSSLISLVKLLTWAAVIAVIER